MIPRSPVTSGEVDSPEGSPRFPGDRSGFRVNFRTVRKASSSNYVNIRGGRTRPAIRYAIPKIPKSGLKFESEYGTFKLFRPPE